MTRRSGACRRGASSRWCSARRAHRRAGSRAAAPALPADAWSRARVATLLGFDVADTDWPYKASFVVCVRNLLEQARVHRQSGITGQALAGDPLRVSLPAAVKEAEIEPPGAEDDAKK